MKQYFNYFIFRKLQTSHSISTTKPSKQQKCVGNTDRCRSSEGALIYMHKARTFYTNLYLKLFCEGTWYLTLVHQLNLKVNINLSSST